MEMGNIFMVEENKEPRGKKGKYLEKENIFHAEEKKSGEGRGGKYLDEEYIFVQGENRKMFEEGKYLEKENKIGPWWRGRTEKEKEEIIWRGKYW